MAMEQLHYQVEPDGWIVITHPVRSRHGIALETKKDAEVFASVNYGGYETHIRPFRFINGGEAPKAEPVASAKAGLSDEKILALTAGFTAPGRTSRANST